MNSLSPWAMHFKPGISIALNPEHRNTELWKAQILFFLRFLVLPCLFFCFFSSVPCFAVVIDKIAAIVNDDVVTQTEVTQVEKLNLDLSDLPSYGSALQDRINHHLILQQMRKQPPLDVTEDEIQSAINSYVNKQGGTDDLLLFLHGIGMNYSDFEQEVREEIYIHRFLSDRFRPFVNVSIEEAEKYYNEVYKPELEKRGEQVPPFPETFNDVQDRLARDRMETHVREWLDEQRKTASISIKQ